MSVMGKGVPTVDTPRDSTYVDKLNVLAFSLLTSCSHTSMNCVAKDCGANTCRLRRNSPLGALLRMISKGLTHDLKHQRIYYRSSS